MKITTAKGILLKGRRWFFTLALFVLAFGAASFIKAEPLILDMGVGGNALSGWIWGGSEDFSIGGVNSGNNSRCLRKPYAPERCIDGNETGVGWINVNCASKVDTDGDGTGDEPLKVCAKDSSSNPFKNCNGPGAVSCGNPSKCQDACLNQNYKVTLDAEKNLHGYGWSENFGWIQFDPDVSGRPTNCDPGPCPDFSARINSENILEGWAKIVGMSVSDANSGGWDGWVKMSGKLYQVKNSGVGTLSGYAWNGEFPPPLLSGLGELNFDRVEVPVECAVSSPGVTLRQSNPFRYLNATLSNGAAGQTINFKESSDIIALSSSYPCGGLNTSGSSSASCQSGSDGSCRVCAAASDFSQGRDEQVDIDSAPCGLTTALVKIIKTSSCTLSCSDSEITAGATKDIPVSVDGGCSLASCSENSSLLDGASKSGDSCQVTASSEYRYGCADVTATTSGGKTTTCRVCVKGPGWIETNP